MTIKNKLISSTGLAGLAIAGAIAVSGQHAYSKEVAENNNQGAYVGTRLAEAQESMDGMENPCAAANPCAAEKGCNPCNPCAAANPCVAEKGCNPCNPCAAANPCAAEKGCNPCNPCAAANPCSPGNRGKELTPGEASAAYNKLKGDMATGYASSGANGASGYQDWAQYNTAPYVSSTHGERHVNNYANDLASAYGRFEEAGIMPAGAIVSKDSIVTGKGGKVSPGPLFIMEKMPAGFMPEFGDWKYTMVMPDGSVWGETKGKNSSGMQFCIECHAVAAENDYLFFLPEEYRAE